MKFSIRDLLLVTFIVALAVAWCIDRSRLAAEFGRLRDDYSGYKLMPDGTVIAPDGEVTPPRIWEDTHIERYESYYPHEKTQGINPPVDGHKETFSWREATGQRVRVEGIAWGSLEKGLGEYVMMNEANIYVAKGEFLDKGVYGRMVSVSGVLRLRDVGGNPPTRIFILEDAVVQQIEKVDWPWMARERKP
jgi:hypothetical protein